MKNKTTVFVMIVSLLAFFSVSFWLTANNGFTYDSKIVDWTERVSTDGTIKFMEIISIVGSSEVILLLTALIAGIFLLKRNWSFLLFFLTVSVGGVVVNFVLKMLFQRERPGGEVSNIEVFNFSLEIPSYSYPSGHMMRATILFLFLLLMSYRFIEKTALKWIAYIASISILVGVAFSRLFLDAHFLSDILGAVSISIVWFCLCYFVFKKYEEKKAVPQFSRYRQWR